jgi:hypothetical protein
MAGLQYLQERALSSKGIILSAGTDQPVAIRIRKIGSETATSVTVTTATNIVLVGSTTTDTIAFATYTTVGAVVNAINATGRWEAKLLDALSSQASASKLLDGAITSGFDANGNTVWDVAQDTSTALEIGVCLSAHRDFDTPKGRSRVHLKEIKYSVNMGTAAVDSVQVYRRKVGKPGMSTPLAWGTESKVVSYLSVDTTETTISWASGTGRITVGPDEEIFVRVKDAATLADATGNYVQVVGEIE